MEASRQPIILIYMKLWFELAAQEKEVLRMPRSRKFWFSTGGDAGTMASTENSSLNCTENTRFPSYSHVELENIIEGRDAKNTKDVIKHAVNVLKHYCKQKKTSLAEVEQKSPAELCEFLRVFYAEARQGNGELYAKRTMITIRYGLMRHFQTKISLDITSHEAFRPANDMFRAMMQKLKAEGKGVIKHKDPITKEDMLKIKNSSALDVTTPKGLQNKVFMDVMLHFCNRGRENLREMKTDDFDITTDSTNRRYVYMKKDKLTKNHRGELAHDGEESQTGRMYATDSHDCPVKSFYSYISRLNPSCEFLWQRPKAKKPKVTANHTHWYDNVPVGKNTLGKIMVNISTEANCSKQYTNHCLRATTITTLDAAGFEARHIMAVSGHKSESSLKHYSRVQEAQKRKMSLTISEQGQCGTASTATSSTITSSRSTRATSSPGPAVPVATASHPPSPHFRPSPSSARTSTSTVSAGSTCMSASTSAQGQVEIVPASPPAQQTRQQTCQHATSPMNISQINSKIDSHQHLHFHGCKVRIYYNK